MHRAVGHQGGKSRGSEGQAIRELYRGLNCSETQHQQPKGACRSGQSWDLLWSRFALSGRTSLEPVEWVGLGHAWESQYWRETAEEGACHSVGSLPVRSTELYSLLAQDHWPNLLSMLTPLPEQQLSEREQQLMEKSGDLLALQKEADGMRADFSLLRNQFLTERKKAEKQVAGLKEALKIQRSQLEKNLLEQKQENSCMQKEMATIELVAQDNHERARRLMKELRQMQQEYLELKKQVANQKDFERRQMEVSNAMRTLKSEVKDEIRTSLRNLNQFLPDLPADLTAILERDDNLRELESVKENFPFTTNERIFEEKSNFPQVHIMDEHRRGEALRERLRHREDHLKAQLRDSMSKQAEVLIKGKRQTEGTLHSLRRQVDALGELVTSTSVDSAPSPSLSHLESSLVEDSQHGHSQSSFQVLQVPSEPNIYRH